MENQNNRIYKKCEKQNNISYINVYPRTRYLINIKEFFLYATEYLLKKKSIKDNY